MSGSQFEQSWQNARMTSGNGSHGGRGGDIGSHNKMGDVNPRYGDTYDGDNFNGKITGGNVGGRNNTNTINNRVQQDDDSSDEEAEKQIALLQAQLKAKKAAKKRR